MYLLIISEPIEELVDMAYAEKGRCIEVVQNLSKHLQGQSETRNDGFNKKTSSHHLWALKKASKCKFLSILYRVKINKNT